MKIIVYDGSRTLKGSTLSHEREVGAVAGCSLCGTVSVYIYI